MEARTQLVGRLIRVLLLASALWVASTHWTSWVLTRTCLATSPTSRPSTSWGRRGAGRCAEMGVDKDLAREALGGLRRAEVGRFYCAPCLVARLSRAFPPAAV